MQLQSLDARHRFLRRIGGEFAEPETAAGRGMNHLVVDRLDLGRPARPSVWRRRLRAWCAPMPRSRASESDNAGCCAIRRYPDCRIWPRRHAPAAPSPATNRLPFPRPRSTAGWSARPFPFRRGAPAIVTVPSDAMATNTRGSTTVPCGILPAPVSYFANAWRDITGAASTSPPAMPRPLRTPRREIFSTWMRLSMPRSLPGFVMMFMIRPPSRRGERRFRCAGSSRSGRCCPPSLPVSGRDWAWDFPSAAPPPA